MICEELKSRKNFVEEDFIELRDSVEGLISVIEKYKDMRYNSSTYIDDLKEELLDIVKNKFAPKYIFSKFSSNSKMTKEDADLYSIIIHEYI